VDPRRQQEREGAARGSAAQAREREDAHAGLTAEMGRPKSVTGG